MNDPEQDLHQKIAEAALLYAEKRGENLLGRVAELEAIPRVSKNVRQSIWRNGVLAALELVKRLEPKSNIIPEIAALSEQFEDARLVADEELKSFGWAPGYYMFACSKCDKDGRDPDFPLGARWSTQCFSCAQKAFLEAHEK